MDTFLVYDITFLVLFSIWVFWFLRTNKKQLGKEGIIYMYRTQVGVKAIHWFGDTFKRGLHRLKYVVVSVGVALMGIIVWMIGQTLWIYVSRPEVTEVIKAPPIAPLIPYFPKLFGLQSFFPPFYFTYFIVALAIVAFVHEFSHGIYMRLFKIKIKSTGVVFLGPILGAFVEEERKGFERKKKFEQMTVLAGGVFANVVFALLFYLIYVGFFFSAFGASGYVFDSYAAQVVPVSGLSLGSEYGEQYVVFGGTGGLINLTEVVYENATYFVNSQHTEFILENAGTQDYLIRVFAATPALGEGIAGVITKANDMDITNHEDLRVFMEQTKPGDAVQFVTLHEGVRTSYNITLGQHPHPDVSYGYLGVGHSTQEGRGFIGKILSAFMFFRDSSTYYSATFNAGLAEFFLNLFWWIMIINLLVALFNMLPLGILDGGRFFYLLVWSITGSEQFAKSSFKYITYLIGLGFLLLMLVWLFRIF